TGDRIRTVTLHFRLKHADLLRVAADATLANVQVAPHQLQRLVWLDALNRLSGGVLEEQRDDLRQARDGDHEHAEEDQQADVRLEQFVTEAFFLFTCHVKTSFKRPLWR